MSEVISTKFRPFDHVERGKHRAVADICLGISYVFPKLDGTNASVWAEDGDIKLNGDGLIHPHGDEDVSLVTRQFVRAGSRKRVLSEDQDNAGFHAWVFSSDPVAALLRDFVLANPNLIVYGEWLVPHSIDYVDTAWRKFYVFDVYDREDHSYVPYFAYRKELEKYRQNVIAPLLVSEDVTGDQLDELVAKNTYLMKPGCTGEGIVVKNYGWRNSFDRQPWMKVIVDGFHDKKAKPARGAEAGATEAEIAQVYTTQALVDKNLAKNVLELSNNLKIDLSPVLGEDIRGAFIAEHRGKLIPMTLGRVFGDIIEEEMGAIVKKFKKPTINFKVLNSEITKVIKTLCPELF